MVDLLGLAGLPGEAFKTVLKIPVPPDHVICRALLSAYSVHGDLAIAEQVMGRITREGCSPVGDEPLYDYVEHVPESRLE